MHDNNTQIIKSMLNDIEHKLASKEKELIKETRIASAIFTSIPVEEIIMKVVSIIRTLTLRSTNQVTSLKIKVFYRLLDQLTTP